MDAGMDVKAAVRQVIAEYAPYLPLFGEVEAEVFYDDDSGHYQLMHIGWNRHKRIHGLLIHVDVKEGKAWIQYDGTEYGIANELLDRGVPHDRIVLAFKYPDVRPLTAFAAN